MIVDWGSVPEWIAALAAAIGVGFGLRQLDAIRQAEESGVQQAIAGREAQEATAKSHADWVQVQRARLLLEFDRDFEGESVTGSRKRALVVRNRIEAAVEKLSPPLSAERQRDEIARRFSDYATKVWIDSRTFDGDPDARQDTASAEYFTLMRLPYWCETLGHQCRRNLLPLADVLALYDQLIIFAVGNLREHIRLRAERGPHHNPRYLEHAVWLYDHALKHKDATTQLPQTDPGASRVDWTA